MKPRQAAVSITLVTLIFLGTLAAGSLFAYLRPSHIKLTTR